MSASVSEYDPYTDLVTRYPDWRLIYDQPLPDGYLGLCDLNLRTIWLNPDQPDDQMEATLAHEIVHADLGHDGPQHDATEEAVDVIAASRFLSPAGTGKCPDGLDPDMRRLWHLAVRRAARQRRAASADNRSACRQRAV